MEVEQTSIAGRVALPPGLARAEPEGEHYGPEDEYLGGEYDYGGL